MKKALAEVETLSGLLPICSCCKKVRDDTGYWNQIEGYISSHTKARFTHSYCPDCASKFFEESGLPVPRKIKDAASQQKQE